MSYAYLKALHLIFVVTWFSGMFYLCRLYVYVREANDKTEPERSILLQQLRLMSRRLLYGITWPSAVLTLLLGGSMLAHFNVIPGWLYLKLGMVLLLFAYHGSLQRIYVQQRREQFTWTSKQLRGWNEAPTVLLVGIVLLAVVKEEISLLYGAYGLAGIAALSLLVYSLTKKFRKT